MTVAARPATADPIGRALRAGSRAPSRYDSQPWRFDVVAEEIEILLDESRLLPITDPQGREARLACGAALFNMRIALRAIAREPVVDLLPDPARTELLATLLVGEQRAATVVERRLAASIPERRTGGDLAARAVPDSVRRTLVRAAESEGCRLELIDSSPRFAGTAVLIDRAERFAEHDPGFLAEKQEWTQRSRRPNTAETGHQAAAGRRGAALADWPASRPGSGPALGILLTEQDTARAQLMAGQALQHVLLAATAAGLTSTFRSAPIEVPAAKAVLDSLFSPEGCPQTLLGFGYLA